MQTKVHFGIIGAMQPEIDSLVSRLKDPKMKIISGQLFYYGKLEKKSVVIAKCGIGKVFAAMATEAMILNFSPKLIINTGVAGGLLPDLAQGDIVVASELCQHDMDTTAIGDPKGLISGTGKVFFGADERARRILCTIGGTKEYAIRQGVIASGDQFISSKEEKDRIGREFSAAACEMEGGAIAQVAFVNNIPFCVIRAISDGADEGANLSYDRFLPIAAAHSAELTLELVKKY